MRKYFIKDASVDSADGDLFNYADIAKVLEQILRSNEPPYNVAIIGKWGLGKSSLINLIKNKLSSNDIYLIQEINAWKYGKESLRRMFLKQLWQSISGKKLKSFQEIQRAFSDLINSAVSHEKADVNFEKSFKKYGLTVFLIIMFTVIGFVIYKLIQAQTENIDIYNMTFWLRCILSYCKNIGTTLLLPVLIALLTALHNEYRKKETNKFEFSFPLETADDYEMFLENAIEDKLKRNSKLRIVTIIDDLDRLSIDKIVEALDSIKAFVNLPNCIFIVPFDDEIIKSALNKRREIEFGENCEIIESELILDKLFQFKLYLPPLLRHDISAYAMKLIKREIPDFITDYCPENILTRLVSRIIIHSDVKTPRQVKKLINAFINNYLIAREREESSRVAKGLLTGDRGIEQIAKLSVLQADFKYFYNILLIDFSYVNKFAEIVQTGSNKVNIPSVLYEYYEYDKDDNVVGVLPIHEPLLNFLNRTAKYSFGGIAPFIYLAQDAISIKTGDEYQQRSLAALESGNALTLKTLLDEKPEIAEMIISYISDCPEPELPLQCAFSTLFSINDRFILPLANTLVERTIEKDIKMAELYNALPPDSILFAAEQVEQEEYGRELIENYTNAIANDKEADSNTIINMLKIFITKYATLSVVTQATIRCITNTCCTEDKISIESLLPLIDCSDKEMFEVLWGIGWFKKLCAHISDENDYKPETINILKNSFGLLCVGTELDEIMDCILPLFELPPLLEILNEMFDEEFCSSIDEAVSTDIVNKLVVHKYDAKSNITKCVHKLLAKLSYIVNEDNRDTMTVFTDNFISSVLMDDVLVYMGKKGFFKYIDATLKKLLSILFDNDENDDLLGKISNYLSQSIRDELFKLISPKSQYAANRDYLRVMTVISVLAKDDSYETEFEKLVTTTLLTQANNGQNYYPQTIYFDFVSEVIGTTKRFLQQSSIDSYVDKLVTLFASQRLKCLNAFGYLSGVISEERFKKVFPLITTNISVNEFEQALSIMIDNNDVRTKERQESHSYFEFLISHLETSEKPNKVLKALMDSFGYFSELKRLVDSAIKNSLTDKDLLIEVVTKCLNNYENVDKVTNESLPLFDGFNELAVIKPAFGKLSKHSLNDVLFDLCNKINSSTSIDTLVNLADYAVTHHSDQAKDLYLKILSNSFEHDNVTDKIVTIIALEFEINSGIYKNSNEEFINTLYRGFVRATSESVQSAIIKVVRKHNWVRLFKKALKDNDEKLALFNKLAN